MRKGRQRLDPDGQPMFNPAVRQQRDKKGHPLFDDDGKPVFQTATELGYDEHGKKIKVVKEKEPKMTPVVISARDVYRGRHDRQGGAELRHRRLEVHLPVCAGDWNAGGVERPFTGGKEEKNAFNQKTLTVTTADHTLQLASDNILLGKTRPEAGLLM